MGNLGEWLNGRVVVSKTIGCVFESRLPCHKKRTGPPYFFCGRGDAIAFASLVYRSFFVAGETRLHSQVFANAKVACDARSRYDMRLASTALDAPLSLAIPSLALLAPYESRLVLRQQSGSTVLFLWQGGRDCIRKFLRMQKLRVTLAVVAICNLFSPKFLDTFRSLFRRSRCSLLTNRVLSYDSKAGRPFFFVAGETRFEICKFAYNASCV